MSEEDKRGKYGKQPKLHLQIKGVRAHIDSIPKIESHYTRARTARTYICGSRSLADIHRDYVKEGKEKKKPYANYAMFHNVFVKSITHKFLIKGHTQNEGDSAHSLIERQIKRLRKG